MKYTTKRRPVTQPQAEPDVEGFDDEGAEQGDASQSADPVGFWLEKQRELVTSVVDYNLSSIADLIESKRIDLSPKYQRRFRWDPKRQSQLIESFLMNVPVPPIYLNEDELGKYSVIDGKQRLSAIYAMLRGRLTLTDLKVFSDINGKNIDTLPIELQTVIKVRPTVRAVIILRQSDPDIKFEVFRRLNTGGVRLNAQEIRNSTWPGPLNDMILRLSEAPEFHHVLRITNKAKSVLHQEMRDAEFVLRFMTFRENWSTLNSGMMRAMDTFMKVNQRAPASELKILEADFWQALRAVEAAFGEHAFQRWQTDRQQWRQPVLASLFDAQMLALRGMDAQRLSACQEDIIERFKELFAQDDFRRSVDAATNTPGSFQVRIDHVRILVSQVCGLPL